MISQLSSAKTGKDLTTDLQEKIDQFSKKLAEVQEDLGKSGNSQDPYKISIYSMKTIPREEGLDTLSSKPISPYRTARDEAFLRTAEKNFGATGNLRAEHLQTGSGYGTGRTYTDYTEGLREAKLR